ncbi:Uncharacterised protein [Mycobacterium tuberculosis]|nr:Uncharacterised protein [Mycobacterium tuberculosis]
MAGRPVHVASLTSTRFPVRSHRTQRSSAPSSASSVAMSWLIAPPLTVSTS